MRKLKLYSYIACFLLAKISLADTMPDHFDIGDIAPRQSIKINMNTPQWPGYHDIKCQIIDPSSSAIIRIFSDDSISEGIQINQTTRYSFPIQISLKEKENKLILYKMYDQNDETLNYVTFQNLDDDVTVSVRNCEISPNAILSKDLIFFPSTISCSNGICEMQGGSLSDWNDFKAPDGIYTSTHGSYVNYSKKIASATYYNSNLSTSITLTSKYNTEPFQDIYTSWIGGIIDNGIPIQCPLFDVTKCPLKRT